MTRLRASASPAAPRWMLRAARARARSGSRPIVLAPVLLGPGVPEPLRPARRRCSPRSRSSRSCGARDRTTGALLGVGDRDEDLPGGRCCSSPRGASALRVGARGRVPRRRRGARRCRSSCSRPAGSATASGRSSAATCRSRASARRSCSRARSSASTTSHWIARQARLDRPRRRACPTSSACCRRVLASRSSLLVACAYWRGPRRRPPARDRVGGGDRRVHGLRQGALAAVPRPGSSRSSRSRPAAGASRRPGRSSRRSRSRSPSTCCDRHGSATRTGRSGCCSLRNGLLVATFCLLYLAARRACKGFVRIGRIRPLSTIARDDDLRRHRRRRLPRLPSLRLPARAGPPGDLRRQPRDRARSRTSSTCATTRSRSSTRTSSTGSGSTSRSTSSSTSRARRARSTTSACRCRR